MDWWNQIKEVGSFFGDKSSLVTQWIIQQVSNLGVSMSQTQAKILNLILALGLLYLFIKVIEISKKPIKWILYILLIILGVSTIISFI